MVSCADFSLRSPEIHFVTAQDMWPRSSETQKNAFYTAESTSCFTTGHGRRNWKEEYFFMGLNIWENCQRVLPSTPLPLITEDRSVMFLRNTGIQQATGCNNPVFKNINPLKPELNPICYLLALLGAHHFLHVSRLRVKSLTLRLLMSYIYIWSTHSWCF